MHPRLLAFIMLRFVVSFSHCIMFQCLKPQVLQEIAVLKSMTIFGQNEKS